MSDITVVVENIVAAVTVTNLTGGQAVDVAAAADPISIVIADVGVQGPPGPAGEDGEFDPDAIINGGAF